MEKSCHTISHGNFIPYLHKLNGGFPNFSPLQKNSRFSSLGTPDLVHVDDILLILVLLTFLISKVYSLDRVVVLGLFLDVFFTQAANIFTRMRWMFRKPAKKHTVVLLREKASTTILRRKQDSDSHFIMFCARLTWVMLVMFDQPCNIKLLEYQITWQFCVCDLQGLGIKKNFTACCVTLRANNAFRFDPRMTNPSSSNSLYIWNQGLVTWYIGSLVPNI